MQNDLLREQDCTNPGGIWSNSEGTDNTGEELQLEFIVVKGSVSWVVVSDAA